MIRHSLKIDFKTSQLPSSKKGFTLLEVMVALAVVAIALSALVKGGGQSAAAASYLRDKSFANWVAMNRVAELRLEKQWPATGESYSNEEMAKRQWYVTSKITSTDDQDVNRLEVVVRGSEKKDAPVITSLIAFLPRPNSDETAQ